MGDCWHLQVHVEVDHPSFGIGLAQNAQEPFALEFSIPVYVIRHLLLHFRR